LYQSVGKVLGEKHPQKRGTAPQSSSSAWRVKKLWGRKAQVLGSTVSVSKAIPYSEKGGLAHPRKKCSRAQKSQRSIEELQKRKDFIWEKRIGDEKVRRSGRGGGFGHPGGGGGGWGGVGLKKQEGLSLQGEGNSGGHRSEIEEGKA